MTQSTLLLENKNTNADEIDELILNKKKSVYTPI